MGSPRKTRAQWDDVKDFFLIQHLQKATRQGKKSDSGFKKEVWSTLAKRFNDKFQRNKPLVASSQISTRMQTVYSLLN